MQGKNEPLWTIGIVNYKSLVYFKWQLAILYEQNDPLTFKLIIVDNSFPSEIKQLEQIAAKYKLCYNNIDIIKHLSPLVNDFKISEYDQHGEALNIIRDLVNTKYLLVQDPDFFWLKKDYLSFLNTCFENKNIAIGAPYLNKVGIGKPDFPACFGCAFQTSAIKDINFMGEYLDKVLIEQYNAKYPQAEGFGYSLDVGYRIREKLSTNSYISFHQKSRPIYLKLLGVYTKFGTPVEYFFNSEKVGVHMFGGSRTPSQVFGLAELSTQKQDKIMKKWNMVRDKYGQYFYKYISAPLVLKSIKNLKIIFLNFLWILVNPKSGYVFLKLKSFKKKLIFLLLANIKRLPLGPELINYLKKILK